jgi:hypothetical protein
VRCNSDMRAAKMRCPTAAEMRRPAAAEMRRGTANMHSATTEMGAATAAHGMWCSTAAADPSGSCVSSAGYNRRKNDRRVYFEV